MTYKMTDKKPTKSGHYWIENLVGTHVVVRVALSGDIAFVDYPGSEKPLRLCDFSLWSERIEEPEGASKIPCAICGGEVIEFTAPNYLWNLIMRPDGHEHDKEYVCFDCFKKKFIEYMKT
jgi:hypothetical protein